MFPALPAKLEPEPLPPGVNARPFASIGDLLPVLVRKSAQNCWNARTDFNVAALEVFSEIDGIHSFYYITSRSALAAVAAFMTRSQKKRRAAYFFAVPEHLVVEYALPVSREPVTDSNCPPLHDLHRHVKINDDSKEPLFREIQARQLFNYRVESTVMRQIAERLQAQNCRDYAVGPCLCEP